MSYGIIPYRVSLSRLNSRFGITNSSKKSSIRKKCRAFASAIDDLGSDHDPLMMDLVEELLQAKASHENMGFKYWYALKGFIQDLGQFLYNSCWYPADPQIFYDMPEFTMFDIDSPMKIPTPDDFPMVFTLRNEKMTDALTNSFDGKITDDQKYQIVSWIREARRYDQDIVFYYH